MPCHFQLFQKVYMFLLWSALQEHKMYGTLHPLFSGKTAKLHGLQQFFGARS